MQTLKNVFHGTQFSPLTSLSNWHVNRSSFQFLSGMHIKFLFNSKSFQIWNRMYSKQNNWLAGFHFGNENICGISSRNLSRRPPARVWLECWMCGLWNRPLAEEKKRSPLNLWKYVHTFTKLWWKLHVC